MLALIGAFALGCARNSPAGESAGHGDHGSSGMECCKEMASGGKEEMSCCSMGGMGHGGHGGHEGTKSGDHSGHEGHQQSAVSPEKSAAHESHEGHEGHAAQGGDSSKAHEDHGDKQGQGEHGGHGAMMHQGGQGGRGMGGERGGMGGGRMGGGPRGGVMHTAMTLVHNRGTIKRTVEEIPGGIRSVTTASDPSMVETVRRHVREMAALLDRGGHIRRWDPLFAEIAAQGEKIKIEYKDIDNGIEVVETSDDPEVAKLIVAHAYKVNEFVARGMEAFHESTPLPKDYKRPE